jgi:MoaA/NifB/PqqE/SkfB family radical SAM enzyme
MAVRDRHAAQGGNRCRVTFQLTFLETNVHELAGIVRLAAELGVDRVKGHHLWAHFDAIRPLSMRRDADVIRRWNEAVAEAGAAAEAYRRHDGTRVQLENIFPLDPEAPGDLAPGGACPFLGREAWVSAEGRFDPCCAPDALRRTLGDFGSLHERELMEIWEGAEYRDLTATYQERPLCRGCNMRRPVESTG